MLRYFACLVALCAVGVTSAAEPKVSDRWAVLIGVDDYANANDLQYCGADQTALRDRLVTSGFRTESITLLHDKATESKYRPSRGNIEQQLRLTINNAEADDLLVVGFSGHGVSLAGKSYLCPGDAVLGDATTLISLDAVYDQLRDCSARFKLVLVDACRNDPALGGQRSFFATEGTRQLARSLQEFKLPQGVVLLNSCAPGEISWEEKDFGHGVYMHYVLEGLRGAADTDGDQSISLNELQHYASGRTKSYVTGKFNSTQRPFYRSEGEAEAMDFALLPFRGSALPEATPPNTTPISPTITPPSPPRPSSAIVGNAITNSIGIRLTFVPAGEFLMGSPDWDTDARREEKPQHRVRITKAFHMGVYEVTQEQWRVVMGTTPWVGQSNIREGANCPATYVSWNDAKEFCRKLSDREGKRYDLPTEAQWEYACRAGTTTKYSFGEDAASLNEYAWWGGFFGDGNSQTEQFAHQVGEKKPNSWGLYDMHGNVWEWCNDWFDEKSYLNSMVDDPAGLTSGSDRVHRGGSWSLMRSVCRSASRFGSTPHYQSSVLGFRVVLSP